MRFTKMQGAGNDYVYVNCFDEPLPEQPAELARKISDRHFGVGGDGLILICPSTVADARMRMFNADGSEAEMCGNGVRCVAKYVYDHGICAPAEAADRDRPRRARPGVGDRRREGPPRAGRYGRADPRSGPNPRRVAPPAGRRPHRRFSRRRVPSGRRAPASWMEDWGWDLRMTCVSMGNPHVVLYCRHVAVGSAGVAGAALRAAADLPQPDQRPFRRGPIAGRSRPCGPGSAAAASRWPAAPGPVRCAWPAPDRPDRTPTAGPSARRRPGTGLGRRQPRLHDRRGGGSVQRGMGRAEGLVS